VEFCFLVGEEGGGKGVKGVKKKKERRGGGGGVVLTLWRLGEADI